jgi:hypothetical protein
MAVFFQVFCQCGGPPIDVKFHPGPTQFRRHGNAAGRTSDEVKALLRTHFSQPEES